MAHELVSPQQVSLEQAFKVHTQIPEFTHTPMTLQDFADHIKDKDHLILAAFYKDEPVGYVIGYDRFSDGSFYSWMGAVIPNYRQLGVYRVLKAHQEMLVRDKGYTSIRVKIWNRRVEMRIFLAKTGYNIIGIEVMPNPLDSRLMHEKLLK